MTAIIPLNISFQQWANELRNSFPSQNIPIVSSDNQWTSFQNMLSSNRCFDDKFIPYVDGFNDWQSWASQFLLSIGA